MTRLPPGVVLVTLAEAADVTAVKGDGQVIIVELLVLGMLCKDQIARSTLEAAVKNVGIGIGDVAAAFGGAAGCFSDVTPS